jgi:hypothetical protein
MEFLTRKQINICVKKHSFSRCVEQKNEARLSEVKILPCFAFLSMLPPAARMAGIKHFGFFRRSPSASHWRHTEPQKGMVLSEVSPLSATI